MTTTSQPPHRWITLITVAAGLLLVTLDNSILYTALPKLGKELGATTSQGLWILNAYPLVMAGLLLGSGTLGDRVGHRQMFLGGLVVFAIASLAAAFSSSPEMLIGARAVLAVGASAMMPATLSLLRVTFVDEKERNIAIGIWGFIALVGSALGPIIAGLLLQHFWWGSVFLINIPVAVVALVCGVIFVPATRADPTTPWDFISSIQALATLSGLVVAIKYAAKEAPSWNVMIPALAIAVAAGFLFTKRQSKLPHPLLDFSIFRNSAFASGTIAAVVAMFALAGIQLLATQRFQLISEFSPLKAGLIVSSIAVGCLPTSLLGGAYLHKIGLRFLIGGGLLVGGAGVVVTIYGLHQSLGWMIGGLLLTGSGLGAVMSVASTAIVGNAPVQKAGMAASVGDVAYEFGSLFAVALLGSAMTAVYSATLKLPPGISNSARENVVATLALARAGGIENPALVSAAWTAFDHGYTVIMSAVAVLLFLGAAVTLAALRRYGPGSQSSIYGSY